MTNRSTLEVMVGNTGIGGSNPIRIQSMTNTSTLDTVATVNQIIDLSGGGAEIVRMTVQSLKEAENLSNIKAELRGRNCFVPLVADVHFNPAIAEVAAEIVEKVRINPGNYGISVRKRQGVLSDDARIEELHRAKEAFSRLVGICRHHGTSIRVGVNHGSLSPRIISRFGNTPEGMAVSAMEFLRFCKELNFERVIVSLKSSNTRVMVEANRKIRGYMESEGLNYPLHLGVTEAGAGEDGRIRSVAGIGTLLWEGTGDTVRVSLTEDPVKEIPVARMIVDVIEKGRSSELIEGFEGLKYKVAGTSIEEPGNIGVKAGDSFSAGDIGGGQVPVVIGSWLFRGSDEDGSGITDFRDRIASFINESRKPGIPVADYIYAGRNRIVSVKGDKSSGVPGEFKLMEAPEYMSTQVDDGDGSLLIFLEVSYDQLDDRLLSKVSTDKSVVFVARSVTDATPDEMKIFLFSIRSKGCGNPLIFRKSYTVDDIEKFQIAAAADFSPLFIDGYGDGVWLEISSPYSIREEIPGSFTTVSDKEYSGDGAFTFAVSTAFSLLQSARARISKTEFISCPSCGRTMFNIQKATEAVKQRTSHLRGLKIAVMGCIVNGPGEMADADYGYVGSGRGVVSLYKKQTLVKRNIAEEKALDQLIELIKACGDWREVD